MKRLMLCAVCAALLCACGKVETDDEAQKEDNMIIEIDTSYGGFALRFDTSENTAVSLIQAVKADGSAFETMPEIHETGNYYNLYDLCAYTAIVNDYYDDMRIEIKALDESGNEIYSAQSGPFAVTDYFVREERREIGERPLRTFSYSSPGYMYVPEYQDEMISCSVIFDEDEVSFYGTYYDKKGRKKEIEDTLNKDETDQLTAYIRAGSLVRKAVRDPSMIILDQASPASFQLTLSDGDRLEERWYEFAIEKSRQDELLTFLTSLCQKRA